MRGVATSNASAELARSLGIRGGRICAKSAVLDTDFDGADEVDPRLNMIKGLGGAMVREKVVAAASRGESFSLARRNCVKRLGAHGNLPIEVVPFAVSYSSRRITELGLKPHVRKEPSGDDFVSDNGNLVLDCRVKRDTPSEASRTRPPGDSGRGRYRLVCRHCRYGSGGDCGRRNRRIARSPLEADSHLRTIGTQRAGVASRPARITYLAAMQNEPHRKGRPLLRRQKLLQVQLDLFRIVVLR